MTTERFMIDDAGTLIDMQTRDTFDYVSDVCGLLNELHEQIQSKDKVLRLAANKIENLLEENEQLKQEKESLIKGIKDTAKQGADTITAVWESKNRPTTMNKGYYDR